MDITVADLFAIAIVFLGIRTIIEGKINVEFGLTNGAEHNSKFIKSSKTDLQGASARLIGAALCLLGILVILFFPEEDVLFSLPFL